MNIKPLKLTTLKAFSLIELMVVIAIVAILAAVAAPAYKSYIGKSKTGEVMGFINQQTEAWGENQSLGQTGAATGALGKYITNIVPSSTGFAVTIVNTAGASLGDPFETATPVVITYTATAGDATQHAAYTWSCVVTTPASGTDHAAIISGYFDDCT